MELATHSGVTVAMRLALSLKIASLLPAVTSPVRFTSEQVRRKILSVQVSVPPPSVELRPTTRLVLRSALRSLAVKALRKPAMVWYWFTLFQTLAALGGASALCCAAYHAFAAAALLSHCLMLE